MNVTWLNAAQAMERVDVLMALAGELKEAPQWSHAQWVVLVESMREAGGASLRRDVVVAEENETLVGFLVVATVAGEAEIESIGVRSEFQRRGIGEELLRALVGFCEARGVGRIQLEVRESNERAIGFYLARGFAAEGRRAGYYQSRNDGGPTEDAVLFSRAV